MVSGRQRLLAELPPPRDAAGARPEVWFEPGLIATVTAGGASDGNALVEVTWRGGTTEVPYLSTYTPTVGHTVLLLVQLPQVVVLARIIGTP